MTYSNRTTDGPRRPLTRSRVAPPPPGNESGESNRGESSRGPLNRSDENPGELPTANEPPVLLQIPNLERGVPAPTTRRSFLPPPLAPATLAAPAEPTNTAAVYHRSPSELTEAAAPSPSRPTAVPQAATGGPAPARESSVSNVRRFDPPETATEPSFPAEHSPPVPTEPAARPASSTALAPSAPPTPAAAPTRESAAPAAKPAPASTAATVATASSSESSPAVTTTPPATLESAASNTTAPSVPAAVPSPPTTTSSATTDTPRAEKVREGRQSELEGDEPRSEQPRREPAPRGSSPQPTRRPSSSSADTDSRTNSTTNAAAANDSSSSSASGVKPADDVPLWERIVAYRPGLPALLVLVLAVIGLAYVYRPQEAPGRKRGVRESSDWRRTADGQRNSTAPPISTARRPSLPAAGDAKRSAELPVLEFNPGMPPEETRDAGPVAKDGDIAPPADSSDQADEPAATPPDETGDGETSQSGPRRGAPARLASGAKHAEYRDTTDPPELEPEPQVGREDEDDGLGDDGPPPDITGQTYPRTNPANYIFRPEAPAEREANRVLTPQGELR